MKLQRPALHGRRGAPWLALIFGLLVGGVALNAAAASDEAGPTEYVVVKHTLYSTADGGIAIEEESRTTVSAAFVVNNHTWGSNSIPVPVRFNSEGMPAGHDLPAIIQQAVLTWNAAGSGFSFSWQGASTGDTGACDPTISTDGVNTIRFKNLPGLTLGQTCTVYPSGGATKLVEFDMQLDDNSPWSSSSPVASNKYDLPTTILHELGHAAGLGHSSQSSAVMFFQVGQGESKRMLTADDVAGIQAAYPPSGTITPVPTNSPTPSPTPTTPAVPSSTPATPPSPSLHVIRAPLLARD